MVYIVEETLLKEFIVWRFIVFISFSSCFLIYSFYKSKPFCFISKAYYDIFSEYGMSSQYIPGYGADGVIRTQYDLQGQGLRNGETPASVYSLFGSSFDH